MKKILLLFLFLFYSVFAFGQTPISLPATPPYLQDFNTTPAATGTAYPSGWTSYNNTTIDNVMVVGTATSNSGANYNYVSRIGLLGSGSNFDPSSIVLAIDNTSGLSGLKISYDVIKIREQARDCSFNLEYSTTSATSGFLPIAGGTYSSGTKTQGTIDNYSNIDISALDNQAGTIYLRWDYSSSGGGSRDGIALDNVSITWNTTPPNINLTFDDTGDLNIARGSTNNVIFRIKADATLSAAILNQVILRTNGTYTNADIAASGFKLWVSTDALFGGDTQLSAVSSLAGNGETITFPTLSSSIPIGTTRYFFVTADIPISATFNRTVGIANTTLADFTFASPSTKTGTANLGNLHTIIGLTTGAVSTSLCVTATQNEPISVPFTYSPTGLYTGVFTAQLSDAAGSFAVPTTIGSVASNNTGSQIISAIIPANTPQGSNYRIRVVSSVPSINGTDNGTDITIDLLSVSIAPTATQNLTTFQNGTPLTATESHVILSRRWKYSTVSGSGYINFLSNSSTETPYFEIVGTYYIIVETVFACGKTIISNEVQINVTAFVGTRLFPGDIALVGWDAVVGGARDEYAITNLVPLTQGTKFLVANSTYENGTAANTRSNVWQNGREYIEFTYNRATDLPAGSIISFEFTGLTGGIADNIRINGVGTVDITSTVGNASANPNISSSAADQIYIMQGTFDATGTNFDGYVLFGMTNDADWIDFSSNVSTARTSRLHPHILCINTSHPTGESGSYFNFSNAVFRNADQRTILGYITNMANWIDLATTADVLPATVHTTTFTVTSPIIKSQWIGNKNENWFDCQNWSSLYVPDRYTDVEFTTTAVGSSQIDETAPFSDDYLDIAEVKNIILGDRTLKIYESRLARLDVYENLTIQNTGVLDMDNDAGLVNDGTINLQGNWTNTVGTLAFEEGESIIIFESGNNQSITTTGNESFYDVTLNCSQDLTINNETIIKREFVLQLGNVISATANPLTFDVDAFHTGANTNKHIKGSSRRISNKVEDFVFPIGKNGIYRPLTLHTQSGGSSTQFFAEYFFAGYGTYQPVITPLDHVSQIEYWILNREAGTTNAGLTLSWGAESDVQNLASLVVAHWTNSNQWESRGNMMTTGNPTAGTVKSSNIITQFSPFTLGTIDDTNILPITWLSFDAKYNQEQENILLEWKTLSESQNQSFVIERSENGIDFEEIGIKKGSLESNSIKKYQFWDFEPLYTKTYYRIKQVDTNDEFSYSTIKMVEIDESRKLGITHIQNKTILYSNLKEATKAKVRVYTMNGKTIGVFEIFLKKGQNKLLLPLNLSKAVYIYKIELENQADFVSGKFLVK